MNKKEQYILLLQELAKVTKENSLQWHMDDKRYVAEKDDNTYEFYFKNTINPYEEDWSLIINGEHIIGEELPHDFYDEFGYQCLHYELEELHDAIKRMMNWQDSIFVITEVKFDRRGEARSQVIYANVSSKKCYEWFDKEYNDELRDVRHSNYDPFEYNYENKIGFYKMDEVNNV